MEKIAYWRAEKYVDLAKYSVTKSRGMKYRLMARVGEMGYIYFWMRKLKETDRTKEFGLDV